MKEQKFLRLCINKPKKWPIGPETSKPPKCFITHAKEEVLVFAYLATVQIIFITATFSLLSDIPLFTRISARPIYWQ